MKQKLNKAPRWTSFHFMGKGIKRAQWTPPLGAGPSLPYFPLCFPALPLANFSKTMILSYGFDCPNISGEWERNDNWMADRLELCSGIMQTFPTECKRKRRGVKADSSEICTIFKNKPIPKQSKNYYLVEKCSFYLRAILSDFSNKFSLRTIFCLWKTVLKLHPSIVMLLQVSGSFR